MFSVVRGSGGLAVSSALRAVRGWVRGAMGAPSPCHVGPSASSLAAHSRAAGFLEGERERERGQSPYSLISEEEPSIPTLSH